MFGSSFSLITLLCGWFKEQVLLLDSIKINRLSTRDLSSLGDRKYMIFDNKILMKRNTGHV